MSPWARSWEDCMLIINSLAIGWQWQAGKLFSTFMFQFFSNFCSVRSPLTPAKRWQQMLPNENVMTWVLWLVHLASHKGNMLHIQISSLGDHGDRSVLLPKGDTLSNAHEVRLGSQRPTLSDILVGHLFKGTTDPLWRHSVQTPTK